MNAGHSQRKIVVSLPLSNLNKLLSEVDGCRIQQITLRICADAEDRNYIWHVYHGDKREQHWRRCCQAEVLVSYRKYWYDCTTDLGRDMVRRAASM